MMDEPFVVSGVVKGVIVLLEKYWGMDADNLIDLAGLKEEDFADYDQHVPLESFAVILEEAARRTGDDALVLKLTAMFDQVTGGLINKYATQAAPTLRDAFETIVRYANLTFSFRKVEFSDDKDITKIKWSFWKGFGGKQQFLFWTPGRAVAFARLSLGPNWVPLSVSLENSEPENLKPFYEMFGSNIRFNQSENCIEMKSGDLGGAMPQSDERLWKYLLSLAEEVRLKQYTTPGIANRVQKHVIDLLPADKASIKVISNLLGKSPRTLQRELNAEGTSFTKILEDTRRELASKYLLDTNLHISQITFLLGFSEVSVFTRAVRRWFGDSPTSYRKRHKESQAKPA